MVWLSNPWVIGVGGGVISGLLVTITTRYLFARRERREYRQKVATANNEIIYTIRPAVAEKIIPSHVMLEALSSATARKYEVNSDDLLSRSSLANELMKEVMDNTFLSSHQKVEFCELLSALKQPETEAAVGRRIEIVTVTRRHSPFDMSVILGMTTTMMAIFTTMFIYLKDRHDSLYTGQTLAYLPILVFLALAPITAIMFLETRRRLTRQRRELEGESLSIRRGSTDEPKVVNDKTPDKPDIHDEAVGCQQPGMASR